MYLKTSDQEKLNIGVGDIHCNWGIHIAGLYETEEERDKIIMGFLSTGSKEGDMQLYCPCERSEEDFKHVYSELFPEDKASLSDPDKFQLFSTKALYYPDEVFSPKAMDTGLSAFFKQSQEKGKRNIRATAEMVWVLDTAVPGKEHLMAYESRLNYFIPGKPWVSICLYNLKKFDGSVIMDVLRTHPYILTKGTLMQNTLYQNPDDWLKENAPEFLPENI